jgi:hypothetical protein
VGVHCARRESFRVLGLSDGCTHDIHIYVDRNLLRVRMSSRNVQLDTMQGIQFPRQMVEDARWHRREVCLSIV